MNNELTKFELIIMEHRVMEVNELLDQEELPHDILDNLETELEHLEQKVIQSLKAIKIRESGLRIV